MMILYHLLYQSTSRTEQTNAALHSILHTSVENNRASGITGFLHGEGGYYLQYLEGQRSDVEETAARIKKDRRHGDFTILSSGDLAQRYFPDWQMGFADSSILALSDLLDTRMGRLDLTTIDPFDLVVFMSANADSLRTKICAA